MMRPIPLGILMFAVVMSDAMCLGAHEQFRIIGKIVKFEKLQLVVDTNYRERFVLDLQEGTLVQRDKKRVPATELKVGRSVVVDVSGDTLYNGFWPALGAACAASLARAAWMSSSTLRR